MCGFAVIFEPNRKFDPELLKEMDEDLFHRGPDSSGMTSEAGFALVFRRLAILDPSPAADQPMNDYDDRCTLVFNGEIYNYRSLRQEIEANGVKLRTDGDTEAILEGYRLWGEGVLERIIGMYTFVLIDRYLRIGLVARDPLGIKPLYIMRKGSLFAAASEMKPLHRLLSPKVSEEALAELLTFGWAAGSLSNFKGIERFPGGTVLRVSLDDGTIRRRRGFDLLDTLRGNNDIDADTAVEQVAEVVEQSVLAHLTSDVGYTAQLSGGVDSSLIAAIAAKHSSRPLTTFGVKLQDADYDESSFRSLLREVYNLDHTEVPLNGMNFADALPKAIQHMEGPVPHGGCVMLMLLCRESRKRSKVVLTGEGADEMFGGYLRYAIWRKLQWQERTARIFSTDFLPPVRPFLGMRRLGKRDVAAYASVYHDFTAMHRVFPGLVPQATAREDVGKRFKDFRDRLFAVDQSAYLESLLVRQDKMSMSESVEARVPFVHLPVLKLVNGFPHRLRAPGYTTKPLLKKFADRLLPTKLVHRRKVGLTLPYEKWLEDDRALGQYFSILTDSDCQLRAFAEPGSLEKIVDAFRSNRRAELPSIFWLVNVELWLRNAKALEPSKLAP